MRNITKRLFTGRQRLVLILVCFYLILSLATRIVLWLTTAHSGINISQLIGSFGIGLLYDLCIAGFIIIPLLLIIWGQDDFFYKRTPFIIIISILVVAILLVLFTKLVPKEFSPQLYSALIYYLVFRLLVFFVMKFISPDKRTIWRIAVVVFTIAFIAFVLQLNAISEWFFWQEFGTRYNFIAVDYLVYTTEVLGNIRESYPLSWILLTLLILTAGFIFLIRKSIVTAVKDNTSFRKRSMVIGVIAIIVFGCSLVINEKWKQFSKNEYANSLAGNGLFEFNHAFQQNELDFFQFYKTLPVDSAFSIVRKHLQSSYSEFTGSDPHSIERIINYPEAERRLNVVMISVESLSADFMKSFGSEKETTPFLDSLKQHSLFFTNLYSSGTRTVRGLEALSMSIPPTPGQSIVKRPDNGGLFTLGSVFRSKGYTAQYIYGGYSYFDNMKTFFSGNSYDVIDRDAIPASEIHYENIWGVADEDLFTLAGKVLDSNYQARRPFFTQVMTVSNHRPYTYPENRIDIAPSTQTREGAVKYTDYAINRFLIESRQKPWFDSTIFIIVADHCAGSAGSVQLPVTGYHIPMLIYAPKIIKPAIVDKLTAQIDIAPTILGLLNFDYKSKFFGQDILRQINENDSRIFISTYQGLGYLRNKKLVIQSPIRNVNVYEPNMLTGDAVVSSAPDSVVHQAIAFYQVASWLFRNGKQTGK